MKPLQFKVLRLLADGEFHSGETMANALGKSRASIWLAVRELDGAGIEVYKVRGRGYRLAQSLSLLDQDDIVRQLGADAGAFMLQIMDSVSSTNTLAMQCAARGGSAIPVIAAEWQEAGRGRMGRAWHAGIGGALTFSLLWRFPQGAAFLAGLSLAVGVALMRAFDALGIKEAGLKWPNDAVWRGGKLAGILIEVQGDMLGPSTAVIGIGVNVRLSQAVRDRIDQPVSDLETACARSLDRNRVFALLLRQLRDALNTFARAGLAPFRDDWHRYHAHQDQMVTLILPDTRLEHGCARGVAEDGALLIETPAGLRRYHSGEISLRADPHPRLHA
ncbi:MAG: biotin--[acetyl-CoA-carboxylase] ligase [Burkholderiales bacterium]|nr:biotin--[acetyl-CoA-carboxylase] ligase [Burkholderiales bacterium]